MLARDEQPTTETETRKPWAAPEVEIHDVSEMTKNSNHGNDDGLGGSS